MKHQSFILAILLSAIGIFVQILFGLDNAISQFSFLLLSISIYIVISKLDVYLILKLNKIFVLIGLISLILLLVVIDPIRGARRWFVLFGFNLQPSNIFMPFFLLYISSLLNDKSTNKLKDLLRIILTIAIPVLLVFKQPDLGTAVVLGISLLSTTYLAGFPFAYYLSLLLVSIPLLFLKALKPYQLQRLVSFTNPNFDPSGINYNSLQSVIAIGSGFIFGKGLNTASQSKLMFLPEAHTDFAFASLTEAFGLMGSLLVISLLFYFLFSLIKQVGQSNTHPVFRYYMFGLFFYFFIQTAFNIGMNLRLLPVVGVPLPFISYGGSSLLTNFILLAYSTKLKEL